jgi:hypothetical protein
MFEPFRLRALFLAGWAMLGDREALEQLLERQEDFDRFLS